MQLAQEMAVWLSVGQPENQSGASVALTPSLESLHHKLWNRDRALLLVLGDEAEVELLTYAEEAALKVDIRPSCIYNFFVACSCAE